MEIIDHIFGTVHLLVEIVIYVNKDEKVVKDILYKGVLDYIINVFIVCNIQKEDEKHQKVWDKKDT